MEAAPFKAAREIFRGQVWTKTRLVSGLLTILSAFSAQ